MMLVWSIRLLIVGVVVAMWSGGCSRAPLEVPVAPVDVFKEMRYALNVHVASGMYEGVGDDHDFVQLRLDESGDGQIKIFNVFSGNTSNSSLMWRLRVDGVITVMAPSISGEKYMEAWPLPSRLACTVGKVGSMRLDIHGYDYKRTAYLIRDDVLMQIRGGKALESPLKE